MTKIEPYDDYETIKKQAEQYIERILLGASFHERHGLATKPTVFISGDILSVLTRGSERALYVNHRFQTICGYKVELVQGTEKLYLGYNLL